MRILLIIFLVLSLNCNAKTNDSEATLVGVFYLNSFFGSVHNHPDSNSPVMTTLACNHPVKVYKNNNYKGQDWMYVKASGQWGFVSKNYLSETKVNCFTDEYPKFFNFLELEISDLFYWGKLYDHYQFGKSKVK